jgi:RHS repeat-associated protein
MALEDIRRGGRPVAVVTLSAFLWSFAPPRQTWAAPKGSTEASSELRLSDSHRSTGEVATPPVNAVRWSIASKVEVASSIGAHSASPIPKAPAVRSLPFDFANKTGVGAQAISVPDGAGSIEGMGESFSAQPSTGIATFSIPIAMPKARGGVQPSLALVYSSGGGNGVAGAGWDIGVPFIARETDRGLPRYDDRTVWHSAQDRFVFNGAQELVPICDVPTTCAGKLLDDGNGHIEELPAWATGWQYFRPRVDGSHVRFFWNSATQVWRVQDRMGTLMELGDVTGNGDGIETDPDNVARVFRWNVMRQLDAYGNEVRYEYDKPDGSNISYVSDIFDTAPASATGSVDDKDWGHHTRIVYEDRPDQATSYRRGWVTTVTKRLSHVDVTAKGSDATANRELLRRVHLTYADELDPNGLRASLLERVHVEGRCGSPTLENDSGALLDVTACPTLPAVVLGYSHVVDGSYPDGFEAFDSTVRDMTGDPDHSLDEDWTDLYDVNADALPDVVAMMPGLYGGKHALWLSGHNGQLDNFGPRRSMGLSGELMGANATVITKKNPNVVALDLDGNAIVNLLHMPKAKTYNVYEPVFEQGEYYWRGTGPIATLDGLDARIDLAADAVEIRVMDANGDGLVDVVRSAGSAYEVWFALGRYDGGDGLFGHVDWSGGSATLSMDPVMTCVPWSGQPIRLSDSDVAIADMNGDGLPDLVRVRENDIKYWPGRGDGTFGTGALGCGEGTFADDTYIAMTESPWFSDPSGTAMRMSDVNGDGLADLVHVRFNEVDVWLNIDGKSWTDRRILGGMPVNSGHTNRVRIVDVNGSGTADILWGDGTKYRYVDLAGGKRPWLLSTIDNGMGATTEISYQSSTEQMLEAEASGDPWDRKMPIVTHVVSEVTVRDHLDLVGRPPGSYSTRYRYRDPLYDGLQREFRGFAHTEITSVGDDSSSPSSVSVMDFHLGERPASFALDSSPGQQVDIWEDNPREALKGLPKRVESRDATSGVVHTTAATSYRLRRLYGGIDGRDVYTVVAAQQDTFLCDTADYQPSAGTYALPGVWIEDRSAQVDQEPASIDIACSDAKSRHTRTRSIVDVWGNSLTSWADGVVGVDTPIVSHSEAELVATPLIPYGDSRWAWRPKRSWTQSGTQRRGFSEVFYDKHGAVERTEVTLEDAGTLDRADQGAPLPASRSSNGVIITSRTEYDDFGNAIFSAGPNGQCGSVGFDEEFAQLPTQETVYVGTGGLMLPVGGELVSCGLLPLQTAATYDRALQVVVQTTGPNGGVSRAEYDGFGRPQRAFRPMPDQPGIVSSIPARINEYHLTDETGLPVSHMVSRTLDGDDTTNDPYYTTHAFVDGLGRGVANLSEADPDTALGDGYPWVASGFADYDKKGAVRRAYVPFAYTGSVDAFMQNLVPAAGTDYAQTRNDAFGRPLETIGLDGKVSSRTRHHALSVDRWDAEDIGPGPHQGTYASEYVDGFGRVVRTTVRVREGGTLDLRHLDRTYLPTGELTSLVRWHGDEATLEPGQDAITRTMEYDSLGRMTVNREPSTSSGDLAWRYVYDDSGRLVGTSDARKCGANFSYDAAGRLLGEDYSPCEDHHEPYSAEAEVEYRYDTPDPEADAALPGVGQTFTLGKVTSVRDRASKVLSRVDLRGRATHTAKKVAGPEGSFDTRWYRREASFDVAGRPVRTTTGATMQGESAVTKSYTRRGSVKQLDSSYGRLVEHISRTAEGTVTEVKYGDGAGTTTAMVYDDLRRPRNLTTYRSKQSTWTNTDGTQQMLLQDTQLVYDRAGNPTEIRDWRMPDEWESGAKPVSRKMEYDDLYRLKRIDYQHTGGDATWVDPFHAETQDLTRPQPSPRGSFSTRVLRQTFAYDWRGNTVNTDDDQHAFYDRSLGAITNAKYQMTAAGSTSGSLQAEYDVGGYLKSLVVNRNGTCIPAGACETQSFEYLWDEVGRLVDAKRWDGTQQAAHLEYAYDASDMRVRKTSGDRHSVYVFGSLELGSAQFTDGDYELSKATEVAYLDGRARVVNALEPDASEPSARVFLNLGDHLGSNAVTIDLGTGELVQRSTSMAFGAQDSSYRPSRWESFREDHRFTGKEDDVELGLVYFGKRYYAPMLGRWISADPLAVHVPGRADLNVYAYVHGMPLAAVDPVGLEILTAIAVGAALGAGIGAGCNASAQYANNGRVDWGGVAAAGAAGAVVGAFAGAMDVAGAPTAVIQSGGTNLGVASASFSASSATVVSTTAAPSTTYAAIMGTVASSMYTVPIGVGVSVTAAGWKGKNFKDTLHYAARGLEAGILTSVGAGLGYGTASYAGAGSTISWIAAASGATNGAFTGARGVYDWTGAGSLAFLADSTWGLPGTSLGNLMNIANAVSGRDYVASKSERQNRQVYRNGFPWGDGFAHTQGNVISNIEVGEADRDNNGEADLLEHESIHVLQNRIIPAYPGLYLLSAAGMGLGAGLGAGMVGKNPLSTGYRMGYYHNPFEEWAYSENRSAQK